jgi:hypothetical protein
MGRGGFMWENVRYFDEEGGRGGGREGNGMVVTGGGA